ncbi:unnamed protein product [Peniophora sp. CBMAI 1063]|nr:unnamed protein product [Peniophora sp. CBMAI 1063]
MASTSRQQPTVLNNTAELNDLEYQGLTALAFSRDGNVCYTGTDLISRSWDMNAGSDEEPPYHTETDLPITTIAAGKGTWFTGSEDGNVRIFRENELEGMVAKVPGAAIRCVAVDPAGKRIAISSDELSVKIVDLEDTLKVWPLEGYSECVRRLTWDPTGSLLATSAADGTVDVWDVTQEVPRRVHSLEGVIPAVKDSKKEEFLHDCSAVWHPTGQYFVLASRTHDIVSISRDTWAEVGKYSDPSVTGAITALAFSPNGAYLASSANSEVHIWSPAKLLLFKLVDERLRGFATQLAWSPKENLLALVDSSGHFLRWKEVIPSDYQSPYKSATATATRRGREPEPARREALGLFDDDDTPAKDDDGPADDDVDLDNLEELEPIDWMDDDAGVLEKDGDDNERGFVKEMVSVTKAQPPFQPGSTPMEHKKRYLAYNMIGVIEVTDQDTHHIINVEFHDQSTRKSYFFNDNFKYHIAALGERGAVYACHPEGEHLAHVRYKPYGNWAAQGEWTYELDQGVKVLGVAAGGAPPSKSYRVMKDADTQGHGNVVVATSENELTFLSGAGIERCSVALDGDFVSMVAGHEWVFVVSRDGATTMDGSQNLVGTLYDFEDLCVLQTRKLPIRKGKTLKWIGISEEGAPLAYDSAGVMYMMPRFRIPLRGTWVRMLDTNKLERKIGKDETYWPIGLSSEFFHCLILKGRQEYPAFPRPLIQELPLRLPFRKKEEKEATFEEHLARETIWLQVKADALGDELPDDDTHQRELTLDKELIQLIQFACKNDKLPRALDLTRLLHFTASFDAAMKVADFYHFRGLREKMQTLKDDREEHDREEGARDKRRRWADDYTAIPPPRLPPAHVESGRSSKPFADFGPPPAIYRPGLTRATPSLQANASYGADDDYTMDDYGTPVPQAGPSEMKRKRSDDDELHRDSVSPGVEGAKRRAVVDNLAMPAPPAPKPAGTNPFAKQSATAPHRNPFNKPLQKSETFFEKAEAAETGSRSSKVNGKGKGKATATSGPGKKDTGLARQTTLFGLPPRAPPPEIKEKKRGRPKKAAAPDEEDSAPTSARNSEGPTTESQETQEETQVDGAEAQVNGEHDTQEETQPDSQQERDGSPIDWPESPAAANSGLPEVEVGA